MTPHPGGARILVIRGGAIGDFILTLPAIGLLRDAFPDAQIEILGYKHIVALAEGRHYAHATRSIEYAGLSAFFIPGAKLPPDLIDYFAGFQQVVSYLYDPDDFFQENLRRAGVKHLLPAYSRIDKSAGHAVRQLARPLERLALFLDEESAALQPCIYPSEGDRAFATGFLERAGVAPSAQALIAVHPGSGGKHKLWPVEHWRWLLEHLRGQPGSPRILLVGGEADVERIEALRSPSDIIASNLPLPHLAALFEQCAGFLGHDSGISHLAAAVGTPCILLFGPTDPSIWAPPGPHVQVLRASEGNLGDPDQLRPETALATIKLSLSTENRFAQPARPRFITGANNLTPTTPPQPNGPI